MGGENRSECHSFGASAAVVQLEGLPTGESSAMHKIGDSYTAGERKLRFILRQGKNDARLADRSTSPSLSDLCIACHHATQSLQDTDQIVALA
jgi:hypothetical protein